MTQDRSASLWFLCLGAIGALTLAVYLLPFRNYFIELQPDGTNLGMIGANEIRIAALLFCLPPIAVLGGFVLFSNTFQTRNNPYGLVGLVFLASSLIVVAIFLLTTHLTSAGGPALGGMGI